MMHHANEFPAEMSCKAFVISESCFYEWRKNPRRPHAEKRGEFWSSGSVDAGSNEAKRRSPRVDFSFRSRRSVRRQGLPQAVRSTANLAIFGISLLELNFAQRIRFEWIEVTYNRRRRHSALDHLTIPEFKESFLPSNLAA